MSFTLGCLKYNIIKYNIEHPRLEYTVILECDFLLRLRPETQT